MAFNRLFACIFFCACLIFLAGCSRNEVESPIDGNQAVQNNHLEDASDSFFLTEVGELDPRLYVLKGEGSLPLSRSIEGIEGLQDVYSYNDYPVVREHDAYVEISSMASTRSYFVDSTDVLDTPNEEAVVSVNRDEGDKLITTTGEVTVSAVEESGYCPGYIRPIGTYDEIAGVDLEKLGYEEAVDAIDEALQGLGGSLSRNYKYLNNEGHYADGIPVREIPPLITCSFPVEILAGYYEDASWESGRFPVKPYYVISDSLNLEVEKTKEGYFIADISMLEQGQYYVRSDQSKGIIEIK